MVKIDFLFLDDEKICGSITKHVNEVVSGIVGTVIERYEALGAGKTKRAAGFINKYFPKGCPLAGRDEALYGLQELINSESVFYPKLIQQYMLKKMIIKHAAELEKNGLQTVFEIPEREAVINCIKRILNKKMIKISADEILGEYEKLEYFPRVICQDVEFEFLETYEDIIEEERHIG